MYNFNLVKEISNIFKIAVTECVILSHLCVITGFRCANAFPETWKCRLLVIHFTFILIEGPYKCIFIDKIHLFIILIKAFLV